MLFLCRDKGSFRHWLSFSYKPKQLQNRERRIYFVGGLCLPNHAALTSVGAQGFGLGGGFGGWRWEQACSSEVGGREDAVLRMLHGPQEPSGPHPVPLP